MRLCGGRGESECIATNPTSVRLHYRKVSFVRLRLNTKKCFKVCTIVPMGFDNNSLFSTRSPVNIYMFYTSGLFLLMCMSCYKTTKGSVFVEFKKREHALNALKAKVVSSDLNLY